MAFQKIKPPPIDRQGLHAMLWTPEAILLPKELISHMSSYAKLFRHTSIKKTQATFYSLTCSPILSLLRQQVLFLPERITDLCEQDFGGRCSLRRCWWFLQFHAVRHLDQLEQNESQDYELDQDGYEVGIGKSGASLLGFI